jgi:hypothetical protein
MLSSMSAGDGHYGRFNGEKRRVQRQGVRVIASDAAAIPETLTCVGLLF